MKTTFIVLLVLAIGAPSPARAIDDDLWTAVVELGQLGRSRQAEQRIRAAGRDGLDALLLASRLGDSSVLPRAAHAGGCRSILTMAACLGQKPPSTRAAELAIQLLQENEAWARELFASEDAFLRSMALLSTCSSPDKLLATLESAAQEEPGPDLLEASNLVLFHFGTGEPEVEEGLRVRIKEAALGLRTRSLPIIPEEACLASDFGDSTDVQDLAFGRVRWMGRFNGLDYMQRKDGSAFGLPPVCVLKCYQALKIKAEGEPPAQMVDLLLRVAEDLTLEPGLRARAAEALMPDLALLPELKRVRTAARLVNAGFEVPFKLSYDDSRLPDLRVLEAAIRQGADIREAVIPTVVCPRYQGEQIVLLGFSDKPAAADRAAQIAAYCPNARTAATAALIRLGDSRAKGMLFTLLVSQRTLGLQRDKLVDALRARGGSELRDLILELAEAGNRVARRLQVSVYGDSR
ncbi:MAG: hypothetical protein JXR96_17575 [Deltaproteobacteria bacterium]|nr:hypothetical protein [Deltaproteobacteria bacterium]